MKSISSILVATLLTFSSVTFVSGQSDKTTGKAAAPAARPEVYHVFFVKAALGKAAQLGDYLKKPDPQDPNPGHFLVLRHQEGDGWDYVVIDHLGPKATVDAAPAAMTPGARDLMDWHNDTFVNGPAWSDFAKAMGIDEGGAAKSGGSVYVVSIYRAATGHRDELEKFLSEAPARPADTTAGNVLMQHIEGGPWNYLSIARYNSWQDLATNDSNNVAQMAKGGSGWFRLRDHIAMHNDTLADRIAP